MSKKEKVKKIVGKIFTVLIVVWILLRTRIIHFKWYDDIIEEKYRRDYIAIEQAEDIFDLLPYMDYNKALRGGLWYSEIEDHKELGNLFSKLSRDKEYAIVTYKGEEYLAFWYDNEDINHKVKKVNCVDKKYNGKSLKLKFDIKRSKSEQERGDYDVKCLVKLDKNIDRLIIDGEEYDEYAGGFVMVKGKYGCLDKHMRVKQPVMYEDYEKINRKSQGIKSVTEVCYRVTTADGEGLLDSNFDVIFEPKYLSVKTIGKAGYLVDELDEATGDTIIRAFNNHDEVCSRNIGRGQSDEVLFVNNKYSFKVKVRRNGTYFVGVLGTDLETIIEPLYDDIKVYYEDKDKRTGAYRRINFGTYER